MKSEEVIRKRLIHELDCGQLAIMHNADITRVRVQGAIDILKWVLDEV